MRARIRSVIDAPRTWQVVFTLTIALSALRGLRFAHPYARAHWFFHYGHGFVKRGLPGHLLRPLLLAKSPGEVQAILDWTTALIAFGTASALVGVALRVLRAQAPGSRSFGVILLATLTFLLSPFVASLANLSGYFDQLLVLAALGACALVTRGQHVAAGVVGALAALAHELFALFGLPLVAFACWLEHDPTQPAARRWPFALALPLLALTAVALSERAGGDAAARLVAELEVTRALDPAWVRWAAHPLTHGARESLTVQGPRFLAWLTMPVALCALHPTTLLLGALSLHALRLALPGHEHARRRRVGMMLAPLVVLAPMGIALLGWDWSRFFVMAQFHAFALTLLVLGRGEPGSPPRGAADEAGPRSTNAVFAALALGVTLVSLSTDLPRVAAGDDDARPFVLRGASHFVCRGPLFPNSSFGRGRLSPWVVAPEGSAFHGQPLSGDLPARRGAMPARPFSFWVGSGETHGEGAAGTLTSPTFTIRHERIVFRLGGDAAPGVRVSLLVDGVSQIRAVPRGGDELRTVRWDVSHLLGRSAVIEVVDHSPHAHLNVEGFCYAR